MDILPNEVSYFNVSFAHRDVGQNNIFTFQFYNGAENIPAYNDPSNASRIYIGFPLTDAAGGAVFTSNLGFTNWPGYAIPCYSDVGVNFAVPIIGETIQCKLIQTPYGSNYAYV